MSDTDSWIQLPDPYYGGVRRNDNKVELRVVDNRGDDDVDYAEHYELDFVHAELVEGAKTADEVQTVLEGVRGQLPAPYCWKGRSLKKHARNLLLILQALRLAEERGASTLRATTLGVSLSNLPSTSRSKRGARFIPNDRCNPSPLFFQTLFLSRLINGLHKHP